MCKVFAMTNVTQIKVNSKFIGVVRDEVCRYSDQDGFGYALLSTKGDIGGERSIRPINFQPLLDSKHREIVCKLPIVLNADNSFGTIDLTNPKSFVAHGRLATNAVNLPNTHPFTNGDVALIHNGIVTDPLSKIKNLISTCDTEILLRYWERGGMKAIEEDVSGYYAIAILDKNGLLHIARDNRADLFISYSKTIDSFIIATTAEIIKNVAKKMKWKIEHPEEILEETYTVFDLNEIISHEKIKPRSNAWDSGYGTGPYRNRNYGTNYGNDYTSSSTVDNSYSNAFTHEAYTDPDYNDPGNEPIPNYRELPGSTIMTNSSNGTTIDATLSGNRSLSAQLSTVDSTETGTEDARVEMIVSEIEEWRANRAQRTGT